MASDAGGCSSPKRARLALAEDDREVLAPSRLLPPSAPLGMGNACAAETASGTGSGKVIIYGMAISGNVIPPVLFCLDYKCGGMELMDIMKGEHKTPEKLA